MKQHLFNHHHFAINVEDQTVLFTVLLATLAFIAFWFITQSEKLKLKLWHKQSVDEQSINHFLFSKVSGFFILGVFPGISMLLFLNNWNLRLIGLYVNYDTITLSLLWTFLLICLVVPLVHFSAKQPKNLINYPQIRAKLWTRKTFILNLTGWAIYLFGYELLFRGILFFPLIDTLGIWPTIAINLALYSTTHIPKGLDETIGALILGLVLCILTLVTGTIWIAFFVHVAMAWTNSLTSLKYHPEIHYSKWKKK